MPKELLTTCFETLSIGHLLPGYSDNWYDALDMDEEWHTYFFTPPAKSGNIFLTVETYSAGIIPDKCAGGKSKIDGHKINAPEIQMTSYKALPTKKWKIVQPLTMWEDSSTNPYILLEKDYEAN